MAMKSDLSIVVKYPVSQFYSFLDSYINDREYQYQDRFYWVRDTKLHSGTSHDMVLLWDRAGNHKTLAFIKVLDLPENKTLLKVHLPKNQLDVLKPSWSLLHKELEKYGFIEEANTAPFVRVFKEREMRQTKVLELWIDGKSLEEIARLQSISVSTVKRDLKKMQGPKK